MNMRSPSACNAGRRRWVTAAGAATFGLLLSPTQAHTPEKKAKAEKGVEVTAAEDLMREHGVLRRALLVYAEASARLRRGDKDVSAAALTQMAQLFRRFGEDYHERSLEERHVFPAVAKAGGEPAALSKILVAQHQRGRQITDYILAVTRTGRIGSADADPLATTLANFVRMYQHHAAIEDTIVFPAWKTATAPSQYEDLTEQFEELEHRLFGEDGFNDAVAQVARAEQAFGLADLGRLTAAAPPKPTGG